LVGFLDGATAVWPLVARTQQPPRPRRIAHIHSGIPAERLTETGGTMWIRRFYEEMRALVKARRSGSIINVSSKSGMRGGVDESAYCASKFGIEGFSRAPALEFAPYDVAVNTITPGHPVHTAMSETTYGPEQRRIWKDPQEIAPAFVHLALQDAKGLNDRHVRAWDLVLELRAQGW
jgi:NAD(P)-dependent dehydrogenase (short-subunit alcohol dehydrogenase family)